MSKKNTAAAASSATTIPSSATTVPSFATTIPSFATIAASSATTVPSFATIAASSATTIPSFATIAASSATTIPSFATIAASSATTVPSFATIAASSATTVPSLATTVPSSATTIPSFTTNTASSSWNIIQSPPSTLMPIVSRQPGSPLSPSDRASYIDTIRYLQSENSRLKREVQITQKTVTREMSNIEAVLSNKRKLLDEAGTERVKLELNIKRLRDDNEDLKNKLEKKTKNLQIAEQNAMIHEKCSCDLQSWANWETLTEIESSKQLKVLRTFKHWMKERDDFALSYHVSCAYRGKAL